MPRIVYSCDVKFEYNDFLIINGFHTTSCFGGPIYGNNIHVKISYLNQNNQNVIMKIEIREDDLK